jgi:hypothetical protein
MARPYLEPGLNQLIDSAQETLRKEEALLFEMTALFTKYRGDYDWVPAGIMDTKFDQEIELNATDIEQPTKLNGTTTAHTNGDKPQSNGNNRSKTNSPNPLQIHPMYQPPSFNPPHPVDDAFLAAIQTYVAKQEEVVRLHDELYQGLLNADRMRKEVFRWCKAEGHIGELSDGEDWVDLEEWGLLPTELIKGREEEENEGAVEERRGRRRPARDRGDR